MRSRILLLLLLAAVAVSISASASAVTVSGNYSSDGCPPDCTPAPTPPPPAPPPPPPAPSPPPPPPPAPSQMPADYYVTGVEQESGFGSVSTLSTSLTTMRCYWSRWSDSHGHLSYMRKVTVQVEWCGDGTRIASFTIRQPYPSTGMFCAPNWGPEAWKIAGGINFNYFDVYARGGFKCHAPLLPFALEATDFVEVDVRFRADGRREDI